jgi:hypothetical protein
MFLSSFISSQERCPGVDVFGVCAAYLQYISTHSPSWTFVSCLNAAFTSGRQKTSANQKDFVWTLFDPVSIIFIHF